MPTTEEESETNGAVLSFSVQNKGEIDGYFDIQLKDITGDSELKSKDLKWKLLEDSEEIISGNFLNISDTLNILSGESIEKSTTRNYKLVVWIQESDEDQSIMQDKSLSAVITIIGQTRTNSFSDTTVATLNGTIAGLQLNNLRIYGNSVQDGTKNLFYSKSFNNTSWRGVNIDFDEENQVLTLNGTLTGSEGTLAFTTINNININSGTISIKEIGGSVIGNNGLFIGVEKSYTLPSYGRLQLNDTLNTSRQTGTMSNCKYIVFYFNGDNSNLVTTVYDNYKIKIQIEEGTTATDYEEYKNSPSPEYPTEIESVGDKTVNLFDGNYKGGYINANTVLSFSETPDQFYLIVMPCETNTTYTVSKEYATERFTVGFTDEYPSTNSTVTNSVTNHTATSISATSDSNSKYLVAYIYNTNVDSLEIPDVQIEVGSTASSYEPYGYKIPLTVSGKNLLNITSATYANVTLQEDGTFKSNIDSTYYSTINISSNHSYLFSKILKGENLTFSIEQISGDTNKRISVVIYGTRSDGSTYQEQSSTLGATSVTITPTLFSSVTRIQLRFNRSATSYTDTESVFTNLQLEIGTTATDYEPYVEPTTYTIFLDEPLRKIGNISDYIDFNTKTVVRKIGEVELNSSSPIDRYNTTNPLTSTTVFTTNKSGNINPKTNTEVLSNYFSYSSSIATADSESVGMIDNKIGIRIGYDTISTTSSTTVTEQVRSFLNYLNNNTVKIQYVLNTEEVEENSTIPDLTTVKGTTIISTNTNVSGIFEGSL